MQSQAGDFMACTCGPCEKVTDQLGNILRDYQDDQIFYEMLQNADDAKATEMRVLLDWRKAPETADGLLQADMQPWQGPAIWVYNNSLFSEKDFENIAKLGGHTKERDTSTIGKFGLGFSSVYHLTDVPCFISGSRFVIFDPYVKYLDKYKKYVQANSPGMKIDLEKSPEWLHTYSNQFKPFHNVFSCDTESSPFYFNGTLFRLSLRTEQLVKDMSQSTDRPISEKSFDPSTVKALVDNFEGNAEKVLLFTKHVQKVTFYFLPIDKSPENPIELFNVSKREVQENGTSEAVTMTISTETKHTYTSTLAVETLQQEISKTWLKVPYRSNENEEAYRLSVSHEGKQQGLVPFVEVATLHPNEDNFSLEGELFTFLPLSLQTDLPVHINGCFAVTSNRRDIWKSSSPDNFNSNWNKALRDLVAPAYARLLSECQNILSQMPYEECKTKCLSNYHKMFPKISTSNTDFWRPLCIAVYEHLIKNKYGILPVVRESCIEWYPAGCDEDCAFFANVNRSVITDDLQATLINIGFKLTSCPKLQAKFVASDFDFKKTTPHLVFEFLRSESCTLINCEPRLQPLRDTPLKDSTTLRNLLQYILKRVSAVDIAKHSVPLLLTKDGLLRVFDVQHPVFCTFYSSLVTNHQSHDDLVQLFMPAVPSGTQVTGIKAFRVDDLADMMGPAVHEKPWLKMFWQFVNENRSQSSKFQELFKDHYVLPMVPVSNQIEEISSGKQTIHVAPADICKLSEARDVFFFPRDAFFLSQAHEMREVLRSRGCRELDVTITSPGNPTTFDRRDVAKTCVATLGQPDSVARFFLSKGKAQIHSSIIFNYLKVIEIRNLDSADLSEVKSLPIFETISGESVSVAGIESVGYIKMRHKVPVELSQDVFACFHGILLAEKGMAYLYDKLGFTEVTFGELYIRSVVPSLCKLHLDQVLGHVQYITDKLIPEMRSSRDKHLAMLFQKLSEPLLKCAKELEAGTYESMDDLESKSKLIVNCSRHFVTWHFFDDLGKIKFIPSCTADKHLSEIHDVSEADRKGRHPIALAEGHLESQQDLVWTVASLLPDWTRQILLTLGIDSTSPDVSVVVANCRNVCKSLQKGRLQELSEPATERLMIMLKKMYKWLQSHDAAVERLKNVPIVPVGDRFVCAHQLTRNIQKDIQPYLYAIPLEFGPYRKLFKSLGMSESPTIQQYCQVLKQIHSDTHSEDDLHPNEKENVKTVVSALFQLLTTYKGQVPDDLPTVFLPDKFQRLYPSHEMYVSDNPRVEDSVRSLSDVHIVNLRECGVMGNPWNVVKCLPEIARPKLLSELFREVYAESTSEECSLGNTCPLVDCYQRRLRSGEFAEGICRIIKYAFRHDDSVDVSEEIILKSLEGMQFICKRTLQSRVVRIDGETEVQNSCQNVSCFVDCKDKVNQIIYLRHCTYPGNLPVVQCVANCVRNMLSSHLDINPEKICAEQVQLEWFISCTQVEDIRLVLAEYHIPVLDKKDRVLGHIIPEGHPDDLLLCLMPRKCNCQKGEYVGYQKDADICYGKIVCKVSGPPGSSNEDDPRYKVDIGTEVVECSYSALYVFRHIELPMVEPLDAGSNTPTDQADVLAQERDSIIDKLEWAENLPEVERQKEVWKLRKMLKETGKTEMVRDFFEQQVEKMDRERKEWFPSRKSKGKESKEEACASIPHALDENATTEDKRLESRISYLTRAKKDLEHAQKSLQSYYKITEENPDMAERSGHLLELVENKIDEEQGKMDPKKRNLKRQIQTECPSQDDVPSKRSKIT